MAFTDWSMFQDACQDLDTLTTTITDYIQFCVDTVVPDRQVKVYPNNKPWITKELRALIHSKSAARKSGDRQALRKAQKELNSAIVCCKEKYKARIEEQFTKGTKACWQGLKAISGYSKSKSSVRDGSDQDCAEELNRFYTRFEKPDILPMIPTLPTDAAIKITQEDVCKQFRSVNSNKAAGPDGITPGFLKLCAEYIAPIFCSIYNQSLSDKKVPTLWKLSTVVPVPKKACSSK